MKYQVLREKYPKFVYKNYSYGFSDNNLYIYFKFSISGEKDICFSPKLIIKNIDKSRISQIPKNIFDNLIFNLGLIEMPSYWKATCSPEIEIQAGHLNREQISWWKDLIINGMGQFFYENKIDWRPYNFLKINCSNKNINQKFIGKLKNRYLVPIGGGKDSIVTLELLIRKKKKINGFLVNPGRTAKKVLKVAKIKNPLVIERKIDPTLLKLNQNGYLNGHTPFTAVLSFLAVFCAILFDYKNIVFSNEKSANEGNLIYLGKMVNHQWSKSSEFEKKFKNYCKKYLAKNINYFSLLRPHTELEISKMFIKYPQYFSAFSSCNVGQKMVRREASTERFDRPERLTAEGLSRMFSPRASQRWCGECPKCLFIYATLYPFLKEKELLKIFDRDIFDASTSSAQEKKKLLLIMKGLLGQKGPKPFECVGTKKESRLAFSLSLKKAKKIGKIPYLLTKI